MFDFTGQYYEKTRWDWILQVLKLQIRDSLMVRMGACRVPDRGSIPRRGDFFASIL